MAAAAAEASGASLVLSDPVTIGSGQNLILNGGFETTKFEPYAEKQVPINWTGATFAYTVEGTGNEGNVYAAEPLTRLTSVGVTPEFDSSGREISASFAPTIRNETFQTLTLQAGQAYALQFGVRGASTGGNSITDESFRTDGVFTLRLTGYDPLFLRVPSDGSMTYTVHFEAASRTTVYFGEVGFAGPETQNWSQPTNSRTSMPAWDNVAVIAVPEPGVVLTFTLGVAALLLLGRWRNYARKGLR